jgi:hypothetical protein
VKSPLNHFPDTLNAPTIGTTEKLSGTYAIILCDPDIPGAPTDGLTGQFLHWIQTDLVSSSTSTKVAGQTIFTLTSPSNTTALAPYLQPSPPNRALTTHRYIELLVNTTGKDKAALQPLMTAGAARMKGNFSALNTLDAAGLKVVFGGYFNVTNEDALKAAGGVSNGTAGGKSNGSAGGNSTGARPAQGGASSFGGNGVMIAGIGAFAAAFAML